MLVLTLKAGEFITIGSDEVKVVQLGRSGQGYRIGIEAPRSERVLRKGQHPDAIVNHRSKTAKIRRKSDVKA